MSGKQHVALITGAGRGIGRATAIALAHSGVRVGLLARTRMQLEGVREEVEQIGSQALCLVADVSNSDHVDDAVAACEQKLGLIDILVNNAGVVEVSPVDAMSDRTWERVLGTNLKGVFLMTRRVIRPMLEAGGGRIVNVSSISGTLGTPNMSAYNASKWGVIGFTKSVSEEVKERGVFVAAVLPGSTDTEMLRNSRFPPRMSPGDVAETIRWLCLDAPFAVTGSAVEMFR